MLFRAALIALALSGGLNAVSCTRLDRVKADNKELAGKVKAAEKSRDAWKASFTQSEAYRKQEAQLYADAIGQAQSACQTAKDAIRKAEQKKRSIHAKPVKFDKANCPIRELVQASEMGLK